MTHHAAAIYIAGRITAFPPFKGTDKSEREREKEARLKGAKERDTGR